MSWKKEKYVWFWQRTIKERELLNIMVNAYLLTLFVKQLQT